MPFDLLLAVVWILAAYLLGAIPFGLMIGLVRGVDVRTRGSGNIGATNVGRILGRKFGFMVFGLDFLKGFLPVLGASWFLVASGCPWNPAMVGAKGYLVWVAVAAAAIIGHIFPVYLKFKGGKGVATSLGAMLAIYPHFTVPGLIVFGFWVVITKATGVVAIGSVSAATAFPITFAVLARIRRDQWGTFDQLWPMYLFAIVLAILVVYRHRDNLLVLVGKRPPRDSSPSIGQ